MNYKAIYKSFIDDRISKQDFIGYSETHHIIPKSLGGSNNKDNLIRLSASDHFFAHRLLARIHKGKMIFAFNMMLKTRGNKKEYATFKKELAKELSKLHTGRTVSKETRMKQSIARKGKKHSDERKETNRKAQLGKTMSQETKDKISSSTIGVKKPLSHGIKIAEYNKTRIFTDKHRENISKSLTGGKLSDETRKRMSDSKKGYKYPPQKIVECPHCLKSGGKANMTRYHFDNCKEHNGNKI